MHRCICPIQDGDDPFYIKFLLLVIFSKMKQQFCRNRAVLEGDVQPFGRQELDPKDLKSALIDRHIVHVTKLVLT